MKLIPRSRWTSVVPKITTVGDNHIDFSYFQQESLQILPTEFYPVGKDILYVYRNPSVELSQLVKEATYGTGLSDIDFNYAIAQNVEGAFVLRGRATKCSNTHAPRVLLLLGKNEEPTDLLKKNQQDFLSSFPPVGNLIPGPTLRPGDQNIHVFDLIEYLSEVGLYEGRNDAYYGPFLQRAVTKLQHIYRLSNLTGVWDEWIYTKVKEQDREYITLA